MNIKTPLSIGEIYHVFSRGVNKEKIFLSSDNYLRFLKIIAYYRHEGHPLRFSDYLRNKKREVISPLRKVVEIFCYNMMPNHFHFTLRPLVEGGVSKFMAWILNSYARYFNTKYKRVGHLFGENFKAIRVRDENQFLHLSRYIHLNPYVAGLVTDINKLEDYPWSSYSFYLQLATSEFCQKDLIFSYFKGPEEYKRFVTDYADYARSLAQLKDLLSAP